MKDLVQLFRQEVGWWTDRESEPTRRRRVLRSNDPPGVWKGRYVSVTEWRKRQIREREKALRKLLDLLSGLQAHNARWERYWLAVAREKKEKKRKAQEEVQRRRRIFKIGESQIVDRLRGL